LTQAANAYVAHVQFASPDWHGDPMAFVHIMPA
jgi:hypothetical protein